MAQGSQEEETAWNGIQNVAVRRFDDHWSVEMAIPLDKIGWDGNERRIGFNVWRGRVRDHITSRAIWQPLLEHDDDSFGALLLPK